MKQQNRAGYSCRRFSCVFTCLILSGGAFSSLTSTAQNIDRRFVPPDKAARSAAIGSTNELTPPLRRAFTPGDSFRAIPSPGPADWLAQHSESGQTFDQYLSSRPNRPGHKRRILYFQPLGEFPKESAPDLEGLRRFASSFFGVPVKIRAPISLSGLPIETRERSGGREQLLSTDVLAWLKTRLPRDAYSLLAITMQDLYPDPTWNFVFGQASLRDRVGVYSFARYDPAFYGDQRGKEANRLIFQRSCKVLAHETGHMFGIAHCIHFHCLMNGSNHLAESDAQPIHLCPVCLRKMHAASQFDIRKRYEDLKTLSDRFGWTEESLWLSKRLEFLR